VTFAIPYSFFLLAEMFSTFSLQKSSSQQKKGGATKLSFCNTPRFFIPLHSKMHNAQSECVILCHGSTRQTA